MSKELVCPFCNKPLQPTLRQSDEYWCENYDCQGTNIEWVGSQKLWQELIRTKELLEIESSEHELYHDAMLNRTEEVNRIRKALDVVIRGLDQMTWGCDSTDSDYTQITYKADGITRLFYGKNCWVEFDIPPSVLTKITIKERKQKDVK
jgi:hypothetical protein